ncbi:MULTISPECIES: hypothetical protein [Sphingobium]|jgi:hypothetical protein|uniref:hypothetical protein n=1 Tax=Sphingobium TaxID=165695 RepID=UPI000DBB1D74|nr:MULTISPECIES: hypothetical protein [Sphingobium]MBU0932357.1 hypothetical protein [Alphaproteobacteria bacterium]BBD00146.1 hypothetical protein YGS_C1P1401 [Sphingobium sp. YG1]
MLAGEAIGAGALGTVRVTGLWRGPWGWGVRPGLEARVGTRDGAMRPEANKGSKVR